MSSKSKRGFLYGDRHRTSCTPPRRAPLSWAGLGLSVPTSLQTLQYGMVVLCNTLHGLGKARHLSTTGLGRIKYASYLFIQPSVTDGTARKLANQRLCCFMICMIDWARRRIPSQEVFSQNQFGSYVETVVSTRVPSPGQA